MPFLPQLDGLGFGAAAFLVLSCLLIADIMKRAMREITERDSPFVADLATHRARPCEEG